MHKFIAKYHHILITLTFLIVHLVWFECLSHSYPDNAHVIYSPLDDYIPFCEYFVVPYVLWYAYVIWGIIYFMLHDRTEFYQLLINLICCSLVYLIVSTFYPTIYELRPTDFAHDNIFVSLVKLLEGAAPPRNVLPSMHTSTSVAITIAVLKSKQFKGKALFKVFVVILTISIICSTVLIKQHSIVDIITALILTVITYILIYVVKWEKIFKRK